MKENKSYQTVSQIVIDSENFKHNIVILIVSLLLFASCSNGAEVPDQNDAYVPDQTDVDAFVHGWETMLQDGGASFGSLFTKDAKWCGLGKCFIGLENALGGVLTFVDGSAKDNHPLQVSKWTSGNGWLYISEANTGGVSHGGCVLKLWASWLLYYDDNGDIFEYHRVSDQEQFDAWVKKASTGEEC